MILKTFGIVSRAFSKTSQYNFQTKITRTDENKNMKTMKLVIVTVVDYYKKDIIKLFKQAQIKNFSESDIEGFKTNGSLKLGANWFASESSGADSEMFFSFAEEENIDALFGLIKEFNANLETNNPIKAVVVPIEKFI